MSKTNEFQPSWRETPPQPGTYRSIFKWGAPEGYKHPSRRLYAMLKQTFGMTDEDFRKPLWEGEQPVRCDRPVTLSETHIARFREIVSPENVSVDGYDRVKFANGKTMEETFQLRSGENGALPELVVHPRSREDIQAIVAYCHDKKIPITVFGGGSSVTMGLQCVRGGITLVMQTHMKRVLEFNEINQTIRVEAGMMGPDLEKLLNNAPHSFKARRAYTCGHFPQSFEYSSVGGWIVTLGSGQESSYYGDMYDIVLGQEYITPTGSFRTLEYPATATGPKINDIMKGSEGSFGILVSATLKIFRHMPRNYQRFAYILPDWDAAVNAAREISQGEFGMPSVFRISDAEETEVGLKLYGVEGTPVDKLITLRGFKPGRRCLFIGQSQGEKAFACNVKRNVKRICGQFGGMYITGFAVSKWYHSRYADPYLREDLNDYGIMIDTLESGVAWDNLHRLHQGVRKYIKARPNTICMTHASHFYSQGTNLYFIFIARMRDVDEYRAFQKGVIDAIAKNGGSLSHHHGVGKMIGPWMEGHLGREQMDVLRTLKRHFDPHGILNPGGTLGLD